MRSAAAIQGPWLGSYPERVVDEHEAGERRAWRALGSAFWSQRLALRRGRTFVADVLAQELEWRGVSDAALPERVNEVRRALAQCGLEERCCARSVALVRELADRRLGLRAHPVQVLGAWAMLHGFAAEMDTGEGKTLAIALAAGTAALARLRTHVITVNDYLVERDARELAPLYASLGLRSAAVTGGVRDAAERADRWRADVVYCSNKGLVFDYLRDRVGMGQRRGSLYREIDRLAGRQSPLLAGLEFGIVDEADSVLIDECRMPLVLARARAPLYPAEVFAAALELARHLDAGEHYLVASAERRVELTDSGRAALGDLAGGRGDFWRVGRRREELVSQALAALTLVKRDEHYLVRNGSVSIIDASTGRTMPDRSWELGLQQMIEVKEDCALTGGRETLARITYQRFFSRYHRLGAATGTAREVGAELWRVYGLRVVRVPRHEPNRNVARGTTICADAEQHCAALVARAGALQRQQQPVLLATRTLAASERLSGALTRARLPHQVLNARNEPVEAAIVAQAGQAGRITIATNMAGRGTDIKLGGGVASLGGLHVIVAECNEAARLDRQMFGRAGRQGDPGSYERVLALDDDVMSAHTPAWMRAWLADIVGAHPRLGGLLAEQVFRVVRARLERRAARQRHLAFLEDRRIGDALSFSGSME
ncbi:MAG TPA: prepilin peptidase [Gammaproteobacteria bacterium]|nr:prepilin peptidase [Gammaproteobacteria bacterium]